MKTHDVLNHYKTQEAVAAALGINQVSISRWVTRQAVPHLRQLQLEALTGGALKAETGILPRKRKKDSAKTQSFNVEF